MTRRTAALLWMLLPLAAQEKKEQEPPEEDEDQRPKEYAFNPIQAQKEMNIGNYYFKKGSWRAAAMRFEEATKWNPSSADAWLRLGETRDRMGDVEGTTAALKQFLEVAPDHKRAGEIKKKLAAMPVVKKTGR